MKKTYIKLVTAGLALSAVLTADAAGIFTVSNREIFLDGSAFEVRGMCYQPTPVGEDVTAGPPHGDYYTAAYSNLWARDFANLRNMGANVIRGYGWTIGEDHSDFLDAAYNGGDQSLYFLVNKWINPATDWSNTSDVNALVAEWESIATELKNHPAVMGFLVGNEVNWQNGNGTNPDFWAAMNQIAGAVKAEAPDKLVSVAITDELGQVQTYDASMTHLDFWALQVYRGHAFGNFFADYEVRSTKPLVITEFGYDAYDAANGAEFADDAELPSDAMEYLWRELRYNRAVVSGGCVFEYADEWWKVDGGNPSVHDTTGWPGGAFVDGEGNEEWWGVFRTLDNGSDPDLLEPRAMFYRLAAMWNQPWSLASIETGGSGGNPEFRFSVPAHLHDQQLQVEISTNLVDWIEVADNSQSNVLDSFTPTIVLTSAETNDEMQVTLVHDPAAAGPYTPANLLANGGFESRSTLGWETWGTISSAVAHSGTQSLQLAGTGSSYPSAYQTVPASPGEEFNLSGYMYTATALPAGANFGLFKIVFRDESGTDLQPASISIGQQAAPPYFGAESRPLLDSSSPVGSWVFSQAQAVAPPNTVTASFYIFNIDQSAGTMYFDSIEAVKIDEVPAIGNTAFFRITNSGR